MTLFPYILHRVSGLSFEKLEELQFQEFYHAYEVFYLKKIKLARQKKNIDYELANLQIRLSSYQAKAYFKNIRLDFLKDKQPKLHTLDRLPKLAFSDNIQLITAKGLLEDYRFKKEKLLTVENNLLELFDTEVQNIRTLFKKSIQLHDFALGLTFSSISLYKRSIQLLDWRVNKKYLQTERSLLQYFSRAAVKTSPFSTFTRLGLTAVKNAESNRDWNDTIQLNQLILKEIRDGLTRHPVIQLQIPLILNSSLIITLDSFKFLKNEDNIETIQTIERDDILDYIITLLPTTSLRQLIDQLQEEIEASFEELRDYILQLIEIGLIVWDLKLSALAEVVKQNFSDGSDLLASLNRIDNPAYFRTPIQRLETLKVAKELLKNISTQLGISFTNFPKPEQYFYENCSTAKTPTFKKSAIQPLIISLTQLLEQVQLFKGGEQEKANFTQFFLHHYQKDECIPVLEFYEDFYKNKYKASLSDERKLQQQWIDTLSEILLKKLQNDTEKKYAINIELADLQRVNKILHIKTSSFHNNSYGGIFQFFEEEEKLNAVVNATFTGYGRMMSRFFGLFPQAVTAAQQQFNLSKEDVIYAELTDNSYFNANIHPPLMPYAVAMPNSHTVHEEAQQIYLNTLEICWDEEGQELALYHTIPNHKKRVYTFDLGFQALEGRSKLYQLLSHFAPTSVLSTHPLTNAVNQASDTFYAFAGSKKYYYPEVRFNQHLIIQRQMWVFDKEILPILKQKKPSESVIFKTIYTWCKKEGLPTSFFYTIAQKENGKPSASHQYKPQFFQLNSPLLVFLFYKNLHQVHHQLVITEFLPSAQLMHDGFRHAVESVVQWYL